LDRSNHTSLSIESATRSSNRSTGFSHQVGSWSTTVQVLDI
jgi:hypothetical protein